MNNKGLLIGMGEGAHCCVTNLRNSHVLRHLSSVIIKTKCRYATERHHKTLIGTKFYQLQVVKTLNGIMYATSCLLQFSVLS